MRIVKTTNTEIGIASEIALEIESVNVHEKGIEKEIDIANGRVAVTELGGRENIEVAAETDHTAIKVETVIVTKIAIEIGNNNLFP